MRNSDNFTKAFPVSLCRGAAQAVYLLAVGAGFTLALATGLRLLEG